MLKLKTAKNTQKSFNPCITKYLNELIRLDLNHSYMWSLINEFFCLIYNVLVGNNPSTSASITCELTNEDLSHSPLLVLICDRLWENRAQHGMRRRRKKIDLVLKIVFNKPNEGNG